MATKTGWAEVLALRRQVQVLERQITLVHWSPGDRMVLAALRERIPRLGRAGLLVKPETVLGWHRALVRRKWAAYQGRPRRGRPPISAECRQLIVRMARENPRWGYFRIRGELLKLGHELAATTIHSVLLAARVAPSGRRSQLTWKSSGIASSLAGELHLETECGLGHPTGSQSQLEVRGRRDQAQRLDPRSGQEVCVPSRSRFPIARGSGDLDSADAPRANAYAERWIGSCRREYLDWILDVNQRHLQAVIHEYRLHYNDERPHRSRNLRPPASRSDRVHLVGGQIERRTRLGGLLSDYRRLPVAA